MAWSKTGWSDVIGSDASKANLAAAAITTGDYDCNGTNKLMTLAVKVVVVYGGSPDGDVKLRILGLDADSANEADTLAIYSATVPRTTSTEVRVTYQLDVSALDQVRIELTNQDSADAVTVWVEAQGGYI